MLRGLKSQPRDNLRPTALEDYIGQESIKDLLWTSIRAAQKRNQPLDHVLLNGPPGLGKTTLAMIIGYELGWHTKTIIGPSLSSPKTTVILIMGLPPRTQLFIDEIHRIRKPVQEVLYPFLEDGKLFSDLNASVELTVPPTTVIGATTNIGKLEQPFVDRFGLQFQLQYYTLNELSSIILSSAEKLKMKIDWETADQIAYRSRGTPRIANNFLKRLRDYSEVQLEPITADYASQIIEKKLHTDILGLRPLDRRYLSVLGKAETPMGLEVIATRMHEEPDTIQDFVEPYLLHLGFMERGGTGRWITADGLDYITSGPK